MRWLLLGLRFLRGIPAQVWIALALAAALWGAWTYHKTTVAHTFSDAYRAGAQSEEKRWQDAQHEADRKALENVLTTITDQNEIAKETADALAQATDDIDARARAIGVRHDAYLVRRAAERGNLSAEGGAAGELAEAPAEDGLPWSVAFPLMVQAEKNQAQLNAILDFEEKQQALQSSKGSGFASSPTE